MINLDYKSGKSIHEQIQDGIKSLIINGVLKEDEQLPSVRDLSLMLTVNPNTVQKAYKQLESDGIIYSVKGKGSFASKVKADAETVKKLFDVLEKTLVEMRFLEIEKSEIESIVDKIYHEREDK